MTIGHIMQTIRKKRGYTQKQLAEKCGLATGTIQQYELNKREPRREQLQKIANVLNVPLYELMGFDGGIRVNTNKQRPFDIAIHKFQNNEELTDEDEYVITKYIESSQFKQENEDIKQAAQKAYDYILYKHAYSFASSEDDFNKMQDARQIELEKKRVRPFNLYETEESPKPFTVPMSSSHNDTTLKLHTNSDAINWEQLDDMRFKSLMRKLNSGEDLTEEEINFKSAYLERALRKIGDIFANLYSMLNVEGQKKADEQIDRAIEQIALLTKIPEYQKKPPEPPQE